MTVRSLGIVLATQLHQLLRPLGFSKRGSTFSRKRDGYTELFHIEGSRWNSGKEPWAFSLEIGARLDGIPTNESAKGLWREAHAMGQAHGLVSSAPPEFYLTASSISSTAEQLAKIVDQASAVLSSLIAAIAPRATQGLISPLPLPSSWAQ